MRPATRRTITICCVLLLALIAIPLMPSSAAAADNVIMILPGITGESMVSGHQGAIDLLSFSASATAPGTSTSTGTSSLAFASRYVPAR